MTDLKNNTLLEDIEAKLQTVYDPEFPIVDIWTLGLVYDIQIQEEKREIHLLLTFTSPNCPAADQIQEQCITVINEILPMFRVYIDVTFDPLWNFDKIKDPDLIRMFS
jgi:metal-sulfur cluster biosynthetic enzyme